MALLWQRAHGEYWMSAPNRLRFVAFSLSVIAGPRKTMPPGRHFMTSTDQRPAGLRELPLREFLLGGLITLLFHAAHDHLGLQVGLPFSLSIPEAVTSLPMAALVFGAPIP